MELTLEIGCGGRRCFVDSIGLDIRRTAEVSIVGDGRALPFKDESFDRVYSSHTIEHFSHKEAEEVLREWIRVLRQGGILELLCPDLQARAFIFAIHPTWRTVRDIYGEQDYPENHHKSGYSYGLLRECLSKLGIEKTKRIIDGYRGIPFVPNCLHIRGTKKRTKIRRA